MSDDLKQKAKKYSTIRQNASLTESVLKFIFLTVFIISGYSKYLENILSGFTDNVYMILIMYLFVIIMINSVIFFPYDYYFGFKLEHRFGLSNQSFSQWMKEKFKAFLLGIIITLPLILIFYYLISVTDLWWLYTAMVVSFYSVVLAQLAPVLIFPLFYKFKPLENENLREKIISLCNKNNFRVSGVYSFNLSKSTKKANAAFTGFGRTKRIILADNLLNNFTDDEIITVFAHELGHYRNGHLLKNLFLSLVLIFTTFYISCALYNLLLPVFGFSAPYEIAALPLLALIMALLSVLSSPLSSYISRKFEFEADRFALETTRNIDSFRSTFSKLTETNLADEEPNKLVEFWFHSHPSVKRRIEKASDIAGELGLRKA
jgi:STE24 endopeptidase